MKITKPPNSKSQKLVTQLLLFSFLLESCQHTNISLYPQSATEINSPPHYLLTQTSSTNSASIAERTFINQDLSKLQLDNPTTRKATSNIYSEIYKKDGGYAYDKRVIPSITAVGLTARNGHVSPITSKDSLSQCTKSQPASRNQKPYVVIKRTVPQQFVREHLIGILLKNQAYITKGGYQVKFKETEQGELQATVKEHYPTGFISQKLPVIIEPGFNLSERSVKNPAWQKQFIHVLEDRIYIGHGGLFGGGRNVQDGRKEQETEVQGEKGDRELQYGHKIRDLQDFIETAVNNAEAAKGKDIVLVLGKTGSGKSTIINYMLGSELEEVDNEEGDVIVRTKDPQKALATIGHGLTSQTFLPLVYANGDCPFVYCDCPGFNDTRTQQERLHTTIATQLIVNTAERIRAIIVVIDVMDLTHGRGAGMREISTILGQLLKGHINPNSILFVFNNKTGRKMKLDNIYLKVTALEKSETEKLEKLANTQEENKEAQKEHMEVSQVLSMLKIISANKENTFLINLFDEFESKNTIERMLVNAQATPKELFDFSKYDESRAKFNKQLEEVVKELSNKFKALIESTKHIHINTEKLEACKNQLAFYQERINSLNSKEAAPDESTIQELEQKIQTYNQKKEISQNKVDELIREKAELDTSDDNALHWTYRYNTMANNMQFTEILYEGPPFTDAKVTTWCDSKPSKQPVALKSEFIDKEKGIYKATHEANIWEKFRNAHFSIYIYGKRRDAPATKARIEQINKELEQLQQPLSKCDRKIKTARYSKDLAVANKKRVTDKKQFLSDQLRRIQREEAAVRSKNIEQERIKSDAAMYLAERTKFITAVYNLILQGIGNNSSITDQFKKYYQHYQALNGQGASYIASLVKIEIPEHFICPIEQDKLTEPVTTKCGHTFNYPPLWKWLNTNKNCPTCRASVAEDELTPNLSIREAVARFIEKEMKELLL